MKPWKILDQTQTEHLGGYCDLSHSIEIEGGSMRLVQRIEDSAEGYKVGKDRASLTAAAPEMLEALEQAKAVIESVASQHPGELWLGSEYKAVCDAIQKAKGL